MTDPVSVTQGVEMLPVGEAISAIADYCRKRREEGLDPLWSHMPDVLRAVSHTRPAAAGSVRESGEVYRHKKRNTAYIVIGEAELQTATGDLVDGSALVVYQGVDGKMWAREEGEFHDGRFERLFTAAPTPDVAASSPEPRTVDAFRDLERAPLAALHRLQQTGSPAAKPKLGGSILQWAADEIAVLRAAAPKVTSDTDAAASTSTAVAAGEVACGHCNGEGDINHGDHPCFACGGSGRRHMTFKSTREQAIAIAQEEARELGYSADDVAALSEPDGDDLFVIQAVERALSAAPDAAASEAGEVAIWSGEHRAYWRRGSRGEGAGYTLNVEEAGVWSRADAVRLTSHCGPEKLIALHERPTTQGGAEG